MTVGNIYNQVGFTALAGISAGSVSCMIFSLISLTNPREMFMATCMGGVVGGAIGFSVAVSDVAIRILTPGVKQ